ncbi:KxYKxGKxW signal peptide domain-containing protein [Loigolactobacillus bifermentans]|uniref:Gram-positive cocci surface proteins LPxTG domain-containing protein n=1 Tax=Loigolactobacillus bifermentans DSM 20003 TaxID=1423726 RepID=A0A0R1GKT2_9LACO|nr:KxYKxGKxW signal peptide domain-containing protein [Loigolactobacillus bifermentans]KRK34606.1 hypothetical protein FC07_GL000356 [Loigolactobacillus bifermentans DSM 20003]QGG61124.1 LPXTG cell wall anchor domain-containing protein [Loigolactobacillus bifermentans]
MNRQRAQQMNSKQHYRLYKRGKQWVTVCLSSVALAGAFLAIGTTTTQAATTTTPATTSASSDTALTAASLALSGAASSAAQSATVTSSAASSAAQATTTASSAANSTAPASVATTSTAAATASAADSANHSTAEQTSSTASQVQSADSSSTTTAVSSAATSSAVAGGNITAATPATVAAVRAQAAARYQATGVPETVTQTDATATSTSQDVTLTLVNSAGDILEGAVTDTVESGTELPLPANLTVTQAMIDGIIAQGVETNLVPGRYRFQGYTVNGGSLQTTATIKFPIAADATSTAPIAIQAVYDLVPLKVTYVYPDGSDATGSDHAVQQILVTATAGVDSDSGASVEKTMTVTLNDDGTAAITTADSGLALVDQDLTKLDLSFLKQVIDNDDQATALADQLTAALQANGLPLFSRTTIVQALTAVGIGTNGVVDPTNPEFSPDITAIQYVYNSAAPTATTPVTDTHADLLDRLKDLYAAAQAKGDDEPATESMTSENTAVQADVTVENYLEATAAPITYQGTPISGHQTYTSDTTVTLDQGFTLDDVNYVLVGYTVGDDLSDLQQGPDVVITAAPIETTTDAQGQVTQTGGTTVTIKAVYQIVPTNITVNYVYDNAEQTAMLPSVTLAVGDASTPDLSTDKLQKIVLTPTAGAQQKSGVTTLTLVFNSDFTTTHLILNEGLTNEQVLPAAYSTLGAWLQNETTADLTSATLAELLKLGMDANTAATGDIYQGFLTHLATRGIQLNGDVALNDAELASQLSSVTYVYTAPTELTVDWVDAKTGLPISLGSTTNASSTWTTTGDAGTTVDVATAFNTLLAQSANIYRIDPTYAAAHDLSQVVLADQDQTLTIPVEVAVASLPVLVVDNRGNELLTNTNYQAVALDTATLVQQLTDLGLYANGSTDATTDAVTGIKVMTNLFYKLYAPNLGAILAATDLTTAQQTAVLNEVLTKLQPLVLKEAIKLMPLANHLGKAMQTAFNAGIDEIDWGNTDQYDAAIADELVAVKQLLPSAFVEVLQDVMPTVAVLAQDVETAYGLPANTLLANLQYTTTTSQLATKQVVDLETPVDSSTVASETNAYTLNGVPLLFELAGINQAKLSLVGGSGAPYIIRVNLGRVNAQVNVVTDDGQQLQPITTIGTAYDSDNQFTIPEIAGYTFVKATSTDYTLTVTDDNVNFVAPTDGNVVLVYTRAAVDYTVIPTVDGQPIPGYETGFAGSGVPGQTITLTPIPGYHTTATPVVPETGGTVTVAYTPNEVTADVTIPSNLGPQTVPGVTGKTGQTVDVTVPAVAGYTPDQTTVPATVNPDGTITTDQTVVYTPNEVTADVTIPSNLGPKTVPGVTGKTGETVDVPVPAVVGYTPDQSTVPATVNPDGTITTDRTVVYTPNEVTADVTIPSNLGPQTVPGVTGKTGETVDVTVPEVAGYTPDQSTVPATVNPDGTITTDQTVVYTPNEVTADVTIPSNLGPQIVPGVTGKTGETVDVTVPEVAGYTPDQTTVPATVNPDGTITTDQTVVYTPNEVTTDVTIPSNLGPQIVPGVTGKTGETVDVTVPAVVGYTPDQSTVPATVDPDGTITTDRTVVYTPNEVTADVTIPSNLGPQIVPGVTGKTGETVDVTVPAVAGYTPDQSTVPATVNPDGTITTTQQVTYTPNPVAPDQDHNATGMPDSDQSGQTAPAQPQTETTGTMQSETTPTVATQTATDTVQTVVQTTTGTPNLAPALTAREQALTTTNGTDKLPTSQTATTLPQTNDANSVWLAAVGLALVGFAGFLVAFKPRRPQA